MKSTICRTARCPCIIIKTIHCASSSIQNRYSVHPSTAQATRPRLSRCQHPPRRPVECPSPPRDGRAAQSTYTHTHRERAQPGPAHGPKRPTYLSIPIPTLCRSTSAHHVVTTHHPSELALWPSPRPLARSPFSGRRRAAFEKEKVCSRRPWWRR